MALTFNPFTGNFDFTGNAVDISGLLVKSNNLSDVSNLTTTISNLGLNSGGSKDIWVHRSGDTMTGELILEQASPTFTGAFLDFQTNNISLFQLNSYSNVGNLEPLLYATGSESGGTAFNIGNVNGYVRILPYNDGAIYYQSSQGNMIYSGINNTSNNIVSFYYANAWFNGVATIGARDYSQATLDVRIVSAYQPAIKVSGSTQVTAFTLDNTGIGNLFALSQNGTNKVTILNNGNVGIGTTTPATSLEVDGVFTLNPTVSSPNPYLIIQNAGTEVMRFADNGGSKVFITTQDSLYFSVPGVVDFYNPGGGAKFILETGDGSPNIFQSNFAAFIIQTAGSGQSIRLSPNATEVMRIQDGGNVGIDTNSPSYPLDVNGEIATHTAGQGFRVKEGSNARMGTGTLVSGTVTVSNTSITANTRVFLTDTGGGVLANIGSLYVSAKVASTSFSVSSSNVLDTSTFVYLLLEPA